MEKGLVFHTVLHQYRAFGRALEQGRTVLWVWGSIRTSTEPDWWAESCDLSHPSQGLDWCPLTKVVPLNDVTKTTGTWHYCLLSAVTVLSTGISIVLLIHTVTPGRQVLLLHFTDGRSKAQSKLPKITMPNWRVAELGFREGGCSLEPQGPGFFSTIVQMSQSHAHKEVYLPKGPRFPSDSHSESLLKRSVSFMTLSKATWTLAWRFKSKLNLSHYKTKQTTPDQSTLTS